MPKVREPRDQAWLYIHNLCDFYIIWQEYFRTRTWGYLVRMATHPLATRKQGEDESKNLSVLMT